MQQQISKGFWKVSVSSALAITVSAVLGLVFFVSPQQAHALTVSPARIELSGDPGQTVTEQFDLINEQEASQTYYTSVENFEAQGDTGTPTFVTGNDGLASWINVLPTVDLAKGEEKQLSFTVTIPKTAQPGGYFAAVFLSTAPPTNANNPTQQVSVGARIGVLVLLTVNGDVKEGGGLIDFSADNGRFYDHTPIAFSYRFNNTGGDRVEPTGDFIIKNTFGLTSKTDSANPSEGNILPNSTRKFDLVWGDDTVAPPSGFWQSVGYEFTHFSFGIYRAHLNLTYGTHNTAASDTYTFFVIPWQLLLVIIVVVGGLWYIIRKYNQWIVKQAMKAKE